MKTVRISFLLFIFSLLAGCGMKLGPPTASNDAAPNGTIYKQGTFVATNGVSGAVSIYRLNTDLSIVIRLETITVPQTGLFIRGLSSGSVIYSTSLKSTSGNQNYYTGLPFSSTTITNVTIHSNTSNTDLSTAVLQ